MKLIIYSQRVEIKKAYGERWDCGDQRIGEFLHTCGYLPVPIPNAHHLVEAYFDRLKPEGVVLTGGNSLVKYGGNAPEKDATDHALIEGALKRGIPVYAFCRGMQSVLDYFGNILGDVKEHTAVRHHIYGVIEGDVNSYHSQAAPLVMPPLNILAISGDGMVEAVSYPDKKIVATMWHPEREEPFVKKDIKRVQKLFG